MSEDAIHRCLECCGGIGEPERHYEEFVMTVVGAKRCFLNVLFTNSQEFRFEVILGEEITIVEFVNELFNNGNGVLIKYCGSVQGMIIDA